MLGLPTGALALPAAFPTCGPFLLLQGWDCSTRGSGETLAWVFGTLWFCLGTAWLLLWQWKTGGFRRVSHELQGLWSV